jgi:hypothetical protein
MGDTEFVFIEEIFEEFLLAGVADFVFLDDWKEFKELGGFFGAFEIRLELVDGCGTDVFFLFLFGSVGFVF